MSRWFRLDAAFQSSPLACRLEDRFGPLGVYAWVCFLAACKRNIPAGEISFSSEPEACAILGLTGVRLVDNQGDKWDLETFWTFLGRMKNVRRTSRGRAVNVRCTHWERWQDDERREDARERQRRSRATNTRDKAVTGPRHVTRNVTTEKEIEKEIEITPHSPPYEGGRQEHASLNDETTPAADAPPAEPVNLAATVKAGLPPKPTANGRRPTAAQGVEAEP